MPSKSMRLCLMLIFRVPSFQKTKARSKLPFKMMRQRMMDYQWDLAWLPLVDMADRLRAPKVRRRRCPNWQLKIKQWISGALRSTTPLDGWQILPSRLISVSLPSIHMGAQMLTLLLAVLIMEIVCLPTTSMLSVVTTHLSTNRSTRMHLRVAWRRPMD